jgi:hypothetical protein
MGKEETYKQGQLDSAHNSVANFINFEHETNNAVSL